jgi:hypothetical protein
MTVAVSNDDDLRHTTSKELRLSSALDHGSNLPPPLVASYVGAHAIVRDAGRYCMIADKPSRSA